MGHIDWWVESEGYQATENTSIIVCVRGTQLQGALSLTMFGRRGMRGLEVLKGGIGGNGGISGITGGRKPGIGGKLGGRPVE